MKKISVANDILPIGKFKKNLSNWFKSLGEAGRPLIITKNGKPAGVLLSPAEYDDLVYRRAFVDSVDRGLSDAEDGRVMSSQVLLEELDQRRGGK